MKIILLLNLVFIHQAFSSNVNLGEIVVESTKTETSWEETDSSTVILDRKIIEKNHSAVNLLRSVGLEVSQAGVNGESTFFLRGLDSEHTIFMIDGIPINDVSNPSGQFNPSYLKNLSIDRIEILKGAQSVLHGGALAGIVNIITKDHGENQLVLSAGSYEYAEVGGVYYGKNGYIALDYEKMDGPSEVTIGKEEDPYKNFQGNLGLNYTLGSNVMGSNFVQINKTSQSFDNGSSPPSDHLNNHNENESYLIVQKLSFDLKEIQSDLDLSYLNTHRKVQGGFPGFFKGEQTRLENRYLLENVLFGLTALKNQMESRKIDRTVNQFDLFGKISHQFDSVIFRGGARRVHHQTFGDRTLYQASLSKKFNSWKGSFSWGNSFRAPSLSELFDPSYGNTELRPEDSYSWEFSFKKASELGLTQITFFKQKVRDNIGFTTKSVNTGELKTEGIEFLQGHRFGHWFFNFGLTYQDPKDKDGKRAIRRSYFRTSLILDYELSDTSQAGVNYRYLGERKGLNKTKLKDFHLWDFSYGRNFQNLDFSFKIRNVFNQTYEERFGYLQLKRNFLLELKYKI